jgi:glutamate synthase domain-containing protein 2/rubredoxin
MKRGCIIIYKCDICGYEYDDEKDGALWKDLPDGWACPICGESKDKFQKLPESKGGDDAASSYPDFALGAGTYEPDMAYIHDLAETGRSPGSAMRSVINPPVGWKDIYFLGGQLAVRPLEISDEVDASVVIGPKAKRPMKLAIPIIVSHMSFGALSAEAKETLARGSAMAHTAIGSGEGGVLESTISNAENYIFEIAPNEYGLTDENLRRSAAVEIKIGQSAKPGMGGHLPGAKVTEAIAAARGKPVGKDIQSPSAFPHVRSPEDLRRFVRELRERSLGAPIGVKVAAGRIEEDLEYALAAEPDFITVDGRPGGTASAPTFLKDSTSVPTVFALARARRYLDSRGAKDVSLIITGDLRTGSDIAKALAMGADAVALATASMMAIGCRYYRMCNRGSCPMGIATQDPELRARFDIAKGVRRLANFFEASAGEVKAFARICGHSSVAGLNPGDIMTTDMSIAEYAGIKHAGEKM